MPKEFPTLASIITFRNPFPSQPGLDMAWGSAPLPEFGKGDASPGVGLSPHRGDSGHARRVVVISLQLPVMGLRCESVEVA